MNASEIQHRADFSRIRYAQCWEDPRLLAAALKPAGKHCVSIGSAGDNSLALLAEGAASVTAVEMNPAQVACIALRIAAYLELDHAGLLELMGSRPSARRPALYQKCRGSLDAEAAAFWDGRPGDVERGIGAVGKFEAYFALFRTFVLPLAHPRGRVRRLLETRGPAERAEFYERCWNNRRWRALFHLFFSRFAMGALGRDTEFFRYVEGSVAGRILDRTRHALVELEPAGNPYLHWILMGTHGAALPEALREENYAPIRGALRAGRFHIARMPLETFLETNAGRRFDAFNLSDIFEYMSAENAEILLGKIADASVPGARLAYWNMLAPRSRPDSLAHRLRPLDDEAARLFRSDRAFFYSRFVIEEVIA